jgi:hypothetical protein
MKKLFFTLLLLVGFTTFNTVNAAELTEVNAPTTEKVVSVAQEQADVLIIVETYIIDYYDQDGNYLGTEVIEIVTIIILE